MNQKVNKEYLQMFQIPKGIRYIILMGGRGAGRSTVASQRCVAKLIAPDYYRSAIMRSVYSDIRHSCWREIKDRVIDQNIDRKINIIENEMEIKYGINSIKAHGFRQSSSEHSAKLKSLASYNEIWIEEAEEVQEKDFMTLDDTLRTTKGDIVLVLTLNPPAKNHWIIQRWFDCEQAYDKEGAPIREFYKLKLKKDINDVLFINTNFKDNIKNIDAHTIKRYSNYKKTNPDYYYQMIEGLVPEVARGRIYSGWKQIDKIPHEARFIRRGLDFGWFPDPMALIDVYYHNGGYIFDEKIYGTEIKNRTVAEIILNDNLNKDSIVIADSAEPKSIDEISSYGINIFPTPKGKDSVNYGINIVSGIKVSVTKRSINLWKSYENYVWDEDKDGNPKGEPKHNYSHCMDAIRYAIVDIINSNISPEREREIKMEVLQNKYIYKKNQENKFGI